ncbi:GMC oxidoreductase-domain-containing protein [Lentinula aciculospora]|uniref:GMC oxidoreductase-domain-containing protein n=1 Tax=Lentinula aciculospora TaxID=153920 RepID=A0A9W9DET8_9AGAR|nr:GMC oxidoreductase-domain-containing protein [Lentinula aciculospora]
MDSTRAEFDIVFGGGGTAACVAAGRLAAANPTLRILILEAGEHTKDEESHVQPGRYFGHLSPTSTTLDFHVGKPSKSLAGRSLVIPSGRCIGGGSSVNFTMYTRASASDYDDWETQYHNPGWGSKDLLPLLRKTETYQVHPNLPTHGYSGPLKVSWGGYVTNIADQFLQVAAATDTDRKYTEDTNNFYECNRYGKWPKWIDGETGKRSDPAHYYIYNQEANENLVIWTGQRVKRVLFEGERAVGLEYVADVVHRPDADQTPHQVYAACLVVLCGGAFGSPAILERSGIGAADLLAKHDVPLKVNLPGVGESFQGKLVFVATSASDEADTFDSLIRGDIAETTKQYDMWTEGKGLLAANGMDAGIKIRPIGDEDFEDLGPDFEKRWNEYFVNAPDKPVIWFGPSSFLLGDHTTAPVRKYFSMAYVNEYPVSMGSVHISSGEDPHASSDFNPAFLNHPADLATLRWGYKKTREIARRMKYFRGEHLPIHPKFTADSEAICKKDSRGPVALDAPRLRYTEEDDRVIDDFHRQFIQTSWHSLGTCAMKPREEGGVVDPRLNVYGTTNLKLSIAPANVGANTYSSALTVGEKAAVLIAEDLGLQLGEVAVLETSKRTLSSVDDLVPVPTKDLDDFAGLEGIEGLNITNTKPPMITVM